MTSGSVRTVDADGVVLSTDGDVVLDVLFDGRRVWSFWTLRDTAVDGAPGEGSVRRAAWPGRLRRFLDGRAEITVRETVSGSVLYVGEVAFGSGEGRVAVVNAGGEPLSLDKDGRLSVTFDLHDSTEREGLLDAIEEVLGLLGDLGVDAFPAYGTLLGAVREGALLGHDSDADLGYVSEHSTPVDVIRESFRLQRGIVARGYRTHRYSGAAFKVEVPEGERIRGLDVFAGFFDDTPAGPRLYLMGEVGADYRREWIRPLRTCTLNGRVLPAPAEPERLLEAMYGPGWKVPDPAFQFEKDEHTQALFNDWFRGTQTDLRRWDRIYSRFRTRLPRNPASELAVQVHAELDPDVHLLDVGAGRGRDSWFFAREGRRVTGYDYLPRSSYAVQQEAAQKQLALDVRRLNLLELRSVLGEGARIARQPGQRAILAVHLLDSTYARGREGFMRFARMALAGGGSLYAEFWTSTQIRTPHAWPVPLEEVVALVERFGGSILHAADSVPSREARAGLTVGRLVAQWA